MELLKKSHLIHPSGKKMVMLGGDVWERRVTGDIISEFKWVDGEPVMILYKSVLGANTPAYMIEMADAHRFALSNGGASQKLVKEYCHDAAKALNSENDRATIVRIIDVILNGLADLLRMPPEPKALEIANRPSSGNDELRIQVDGKTIIETQV
jgi:hypothetical protein